MDNTLKARRHFSVDHSSVLYALSDEAKRFFEAISSVFFLKNQTAGLGIFFSLFIVDSSAALIAAFAALSMGLSAKVLNSEMQLNQSGLFYLNGWFLGLTANLFLNFTAATMIGLAISSLIGVYLVVASYRILSVWGLPILVLPYVLASWLLVEYGQMSEVITLKSVNGLAGPDFIYDALPRELGLLFKGIGQIFFVENAGLGLMLFGVLILVNAKAALYGLLASGAGYFLSVKLGVSEAVLSSGLTVFPVFLLLMAYGSGFLTFSWPSLFLGVALGGVFETWCIEFFARLDLPALSLSYIFLIWLMKINQPLRRSKKIVWDII